MVAVGRDALRVGETRWVVGVRHEVGREKGCEEAVFVVMAMWRPWWRWVVGAGRGRRRRKGGGSRAARAFLLPMGAQHS
jgi:hypothetical protein